MVVLASDYDSHGCLAADHDETQETWATEIDILRQSSKPKSTVDTKGAPYYREGRDFSDMLAIDSNALNELQGLGRGLSVAFGSIKEAEGSLDSPHASRRKSPHGRENQKMVMLEQVGIKQPRVSRLTQRFHG